MIKKKYLSLLLLLFITADGFAQQKYAVIVGINKYYDRPGVLHSGAVLEGCVNDAMSIKSLLTQRFGFDEKNMTMVLDAAATRQHVVTALMAVLDKCKAGDAIVFYFSGHGAWMTNTGQDERERAIKHGMDQAMVMSNLYAPDLDCLFPDVLVKAIFTKFAEKKVVSTTIFDCCFAGKMEMDPLPRAITTSQKTGWARGKKVSVGPVIRRSDTYTDLQSGMYNPKYLAFDDIYALSKNYKQADADSGKVDEPDETRFSFKSFNLSDALKIDDSARIIPPSMIPNSMALSLAGTNDSEPGLDITDDENNHHGAFTKALLEVMRKSPATITVDELIQKISVLIALEQYPQHPMHFQDNARLHLNLIGITPEGFTDPRTRSVKAKPMHILKVFVGGTAMTAVQLKQFIAQNAAPLAKMPNFNDHKSWDPDSSRNLFFNEHPVHAGSAAKALVKKKNTESFFVFLPIPTFITEPLNRLLRANPNIGVVQSADSADLILYLDYLSDGTLNFSWNNLNRKEVNHYVQVTSVFYDVPELPTDLVAIKKLSLNIQNMLLEYARAKTDRWLIDWPMGYD